eukprot:359644-Chlamydomonas_euryale.AAC.3
MARTTPQQWSMLRLICAANSLGLVTWVPRMTCVVLSRAERRLTYPSFNMSAPASSAADVHLATLRAPAATALEKAAGLDTHTSQCDRWWWHRQGQEVATHVFECVRI